MTKAKRNTQRIFNIVITVLTLAGVFLMLRNTDSGTGLTATGIENLKFYTVLSNIFCGITAVICLAFDLIRRDRGGVLPRPLIFLKLASAASVGLTFLVIAAFLGPIYGHVNLYHGSNLVFHLLLPLAGMADMCLLYTKDGKGIPFAWTPAAALPTFAYGSFYLINILVNGVGTWPEGNDWYGFVNWGMPVGICIFAGITAASFALAVLLRVLNRRVNR